MEDEAPHDSLAREFAGTDFTPEYAGRELDANGAMERPCIACGATNWRVGRLLTGLLAVSPENVLDLNDAMAARVVSVVCMECGFIRLHDWAVLSD